MFSARAAVARAARGRLDHGRRYLNRKLRAAGEALRLTLLRKPVISFRALERVPAFYVLLQTADYAPTSLEFHLTRVVSPRARAV